MSPPPNRVRDRREALGLAQRALAEAAGLSRQSLFAIERGQADPSVAVALRIAAALDATVEELFGVAASPEGLRAELAAGRDVPPGPLRVALARLHDRWVAHPFGPEDLPVAADGLVLVAPAAGAGRVVEVRLLRPSRELPDSVVLAGCAPPLGLLADRVSRTRGAPRALWLDHGNAGALAALGAHHVSAAGVHGADRPPDEVARSLGKSLPPGRFRVIALARWRAGLVVARGNPLGIRGAADLAREDVRFVRREQGSGARALVERELRRVRLEPVEVLARARETRGHLAVARAVALGAADAGVAIEPAALALGLGFVSLEEERFDLVLDAEPRDDAGLRRVLDVLTSRAFRDDVAILGGYDVSRSGDVVAELEGGAG